MINVQILVPALYGALGALGHEIVDDGTISLPRIYDGQLYLGVFAGMIIGAISGFFLRENALASVTAGYSAISIGKKLLPYAPAAPTAPAGDMETIIRAICLQQGVDADLAVRVAKCESSLNPTATNTNAPNSIDRGLFQINSRFHPEVSDLQAFDPIFSTKFFCDAVKNGNITWWSASKTCWNLA